jgi:cold shock CspA family protein
VRIDITAPHEEIGVVHEPPEHDPHYKDVNVAIRDAFGSAARKLEEYVRRQRKDVKRHGVAAHGRIGKLFPQERYGFIDTSDGREVYFHANSLIEGGFDDLTMGTEVSFAEESGDKGPQASTVQVHSRHHHAI